jgi:archaellum biogenesis protein FlaJ (TadC family)
VAGRITWAHTLYTALLGLWLGAFVVVGAMIVPMLFSTLAAHTAVDSAVTVFRLQGFVGFVLLALLLLARLTSDLRAITLENKLLAAVLLCAVLLQFWVIPELLAQRTQAVKEPLWHLAASALYLLQTVAVLVMFIQRIRTPTLTVPRAAKRVTQTALDATIAPTQTEVISEVSPDLAANVQQLNP